MNENYDLKKFGEDKIVLLGLFVLSLVIAELIVSINSIILFSEPIALLHAGLSLSIPIGKGWQSAGKWQYEDNAFVLSSNFMGDSGVPAALVNCRYFMTSQNELKNLPIKQFADDSNSTIADTDKIQKGSLTIYQAHLEKPFTAFLGTLELPNNRTMSIEVIQTTFEIDIAERVFKKIIDSLQYSADNPVKTGSDIVTEIQSAGIVSLLNSDNRQACFFIQDINNRNIGFTVDLLDYTQNGEQTGIRGASQLYVSELNFQEQVTVFQCDNNLGRFAWQSRTGTRAGRINTKIVFDETGTVTRQVNNSYEENRYPAGTKILPSIFLELLIGVIVQNKVKEASVELINPDGKIFPVVLTYKSANEKRGIVILEFPDSRGLSETFYLGDDGRIIRAVIEGKGGYNLERTDMTGIEAEFPVQAAYLLKQYGARENNGL